MSAYEIFKIVVFCTCIISGLTVFVSAFKLIRPESKRLRSEYQSFFPILWLFSLTYLYLLGGIIFFGILPPYLVFGFIEMLIDDRSGLERFDDGVASYQNFIIFIWKIRFPIIILATFHILSLLIYFLPKIMNFNFDRSITNRLVKKNYYRSVILYSFLFAIFLLGLSHLNGVRNSDFWNLGSCKIFFQERHITLSDCVTTLHPRQIWHSFTNS